MEIKPNIYIYILAGMIVRDNQTNQWRTTNFNEPDNFGVSGDRLRVLAGSYLFKENPESLIIVSGGKGQLKNISDAPTVAEVMKKELIELGVPAEKIIEEKNSGTTYEQLKELKKIIGELRPEKIKIISNRYHLPRVEAMIENFSELKEMKKFTDIKLIEAEEIILKYERQKWQEIIECVYRSKEMEKRIEIENTGVQRIKEGIYKFV